jgi:AraC-like DNA-binding protein
MIQTGHVGTPPLSVFNAVNTFDPGEAEDGVARIFCPHRLTPVRRGAPGFHAMHNSARFDGYSVNYVQYGAEVEIDPGRLDGFFLLQVPIRGRAVVRTRGREVESSPRAVASILSPTLPTQMIWQNDCAQLIMLVDRQQVEKRAAALAERPTSAVEFEPHIDLNTPFGQALQSQIVYLVDLAERGPASNLSPVTAATLRESIVGLLLTGQRSNLSAVINRSASVREPVPAVFRRARERLEAHAEQPLDLEKLAQLSGIGIRSLQLGFRRHFGISISGALLDIRLERLRARLSHMKPGERIVDIAFDLGFSHLSRTASVYRAKFGESPSETLRRSR